MTDIFDDLQPVHHIATESHETDMIGDLQPVQDVILNPNMDKCPAYELVSQSQVLGSLFFLIPLKYTLHSKC